MNLDIFFTAQHQTLQGNGKPVAEANGALGGENGASLGSLGFLDMILGLIGEDLEKSDDKSLSAEQEDILKEAAEALTSDNPLLAEKPKLDLAKLIAANPEIEEQIEEFTQSTGLDSMVALEQALVLNQKSFDNIIKPLTDGIITIEEIKKGSPRLLNALLIEDDLEDEELLDKIEAAIAKIQKLKEEDQASLININLTPGQITALERQIEHRIINNDGANEDLVEAAEELNELLSGFIGFAPIAPVKAEQAKQPAAVNIVQAQSVPTPSMQEIASRLNALNVGGQDGSAEQSADEGFTWGDDGFDGDFDAFIERFLNKPTDGKSLAPANANTPAPSTQSTANPAVLNFQNMPNVIMDDALLQNFEMTAGFVEEFAPLAANSNTAMAALTNLATQASQAGAMHPAMQTIAAQIQKFSGQGDSTEFRIQLDPPELGRVEVQMSFGKDKTLKTGIIVERPETYMMLQRDAQMLERAMQDLGLESEGLDLQLAEQGFDFEGDNQRGGGHDQGGTGSGADGEEMEILESTMTWHVDPETGHMRYDILV